MSQQWEEINIPQGTFIGWGRKGQSIVFETVHFSEDGGTDFNGNPCPQVVGVALEETENYRDKGTKEMIPAKEYITLTCGQANLSKKMVAAALQPGDISKITYEDDYRTARGTGKSFDVRVRRGDGTVKHAPEPVAATKEPEW